MRVGVFFRKNRIFFSNPTCASLCLNADTLVVIRCTYKLYKKTKFDARWDTLGTFSGLQRWSHLAKMPIFDIKLTNTTNNRFTKPKLTHSVIQHHS